MARATTAKGVLALLGGTAVGFLIAGGLLVVDGFEIFLLRELIGGSTAEGLGLLTAVGLQLYVSRFRGLDSEMAND